MTAPRTDTTVHDRYLAEANAELDAMLGEVGEIDSTPPPPRDAGRTWMQLLVIAAIALVVFVVGVLLLRGRRPRMSMHIVR